MKRKIFIVFIFLILIIAFSPGFGVFGEIYFPGQVMVLSLSSNGEYAVSSNKNKTIILWNLKKHTYKIISLNANIYSAYFVKHSNNFMWQDLNNVVHIDNINGQQIKYFKMPATYGQIITPDLKTYFATDQDWNIYKRTNGKVTVIKESYQVGGFLGAGKLMNLSLSPNNQYLLTSGLADGYDSLPISAGVNAHQATDNGYGNEVGIANESTFNGITLWDIKTGKPLRKFPGMNFKAFATFDPSGNYVIGGDEDMLAYVWNLLGNTKKGLYGLIKGKYMGNVDGKDVWNKKGLIPMPKDFVDWHGQEIWPGIVSMKFIDKNNYLRLSYDSPYVILYKTTDPKPLKYIRLGKKPWPSIDSYVRDESIDTAPAAHILVTGQLAGNGIIVYKYNPKTQTLKRTWVGNVKEFL